MLGASRPVSFVPAADLDRAQTFYADVLGLEFLEDAKFARVFRLGDATLRVTHVDDFKAQPFTVLGWEVANVAEALAQLKSQGVQAERYDGLDQDDAGVWRAPSGDLVAWFRDSEGNSLSVTQKV